MTNLKTLSDAVREDYKNQIVTEANDHCLRLAVMNGEYRWHFHATSDELFVVLEGKLVVEFRDRETVVMNPMDTLLVPAGVVHKTRSEGRSVNVCFEKTLADTTFVD